MDLGWAELSSIVVALIAIYGAVLSTINYIEKRRENKPQIKIDVAQGIVGCPDGSKQNLYTVRVRNFGKIVTLHLVYIESIPSIKNRIEKKLFGKKYQKISVFKPANGKELENGKFYDFRFLGNDFPSEVPFQTKLKYNVQLQSVVYTKCCKM